MQYLSSAFTKAVGSLFAPGMIGILLMSLVITITALACFFFGASAFFFWLFESSWLAWLGAFGSGIFSWFLFPAIMPIIVNFFDTRIVRLIERHQYPHAQGAIEPPFLPEFLHDARFTLKALLLNLLALPFYLIPVVNLLLFYSLNGYLLGKEFFIMVARQHIPIDDAVALHKRHTRTASLAGTGLAIAATIPIINLFAPIWGIAVMTHLYHAINDTPKAEILPPNQ
ncbi:MAG: EI24 domain-containing protein [Rickettsiales bacterium]